MDRRTALLAMASTVAPTTLAQTGTGPRSIRGANEYQALALEEGEFALLTSRVVLDRARGQRVRSFAHLEINE